MRLTHRNRIFKLTQELGFTIDSFDFIEKDKDDDHVEVTSIAFKGSPFKFMIRNNAEDFNSYDCKYTMYAPNYNFSPWYPTSEWANIESIENFYTYWLNTQLSSYLEDQNEPDLWAEYKNANKTFDFNKIDFDHKESFSLDEKTQIKLAINELRLLIQKELDTDEQSQKIVNERLDYLIESSNRLNKFDWKSLVISSVIGIATSLSLDTQKGQMLFTLLRKVFAHFPVLGT